MKLVLSSSGSHTNAEKIWAAVEGVDEKHDEEDGVVHRARVPLLAMRLKEESGEPEDNVNHEREHRA